MSEVLSTVLFCATSLVTGVALTLKWLFVMGERRGGTEPGVSCLGNTICIALFFVAAILVILGLAQGHSLELLVRSASILARRLVARRHGLCAPVLVRVGRQTGPVRL